MPNFSFDWYHCYARVVDMFVYLNVIYTIHLFHRNKPSRPADFPTFRPCRLIDSNGNGSVSKLKVFHFKTDVFFDRINFEALYPLLKEFYFDVHLSYLSNFLKC